MSEEALAWAPDACTLPTAEKPLRLAEFDRVFATSVRAVEGVTPTRARLDLAADPAVAARVANLVVREAGCCSFFTFSLVATGGGLVLEVAVPPEHVDVLDALVARAAAGGRP